MRKEYRGAAPPTILTSSMSPTSQSFSVAEPSGYPTGVPGPFSIVLDENTASEEEVLCSGRSGNTFTVAAGGRGAADTLAVSHSTGAGVRHVYSRDDADEANLHVNSDDGVHGVTGDVVGTTDNQTLTNKTISGLDNSITAVPQSGVTGLTNELDRLNRQDGSIAVGYFGPDSAKVAFTCPIPAWAQGFRRFQIEIVSRGTAGDTSDFPSVSLRFNTASASGNDNEWARFMSIRHTTDTAGDAGTIDRFNTTGDADYGYACANGISHTSAALTLSRIFVTDPWRVDGEFGARGGGPGGTATARLAIGQTFSRWLGTEQINMIRFGQVQGGIDFSSNTRVAIFGIPRPGFDADLRGDPTVDLNR